MINFSQNLNTRFTPRPIASAPAKVKSAGRFGKLPPEVQDHIFSYAEPKEIGRIGQTGKLLQENLSSRADTEVRQNLQSRLERFILAGQVREMSTPKLAKAADAVTRQTHTISLTQTPNTGGLHVPYGLVRAYGTSGSISRLEDIMTGRAPNTTLLRLGKFSPDDSLFVAASLTRSDTNAILPEISVYKKSGNFDYQRVASVYTFPEKKQNMYPEKLEFTPEGFSIQFKSSNWDCSQSGSTVQKADIDTEVRQFHIKP